MIIEVIPETKTSGETEVFSYSVPEELESEIGIGSVVQIPLGNRKIRGVVNEIGTKDHTDFKTRDILGLAAVPVLPYFYLKVAKWISSYYLCSLGEAISIFLPPIIKQPRKQPAPIPPEFKAKIELSKEQEPIFQALAKKMSDENKKPALIFGVTGSGKTEIYIKLAEYALLEGKQVVVLVPEIILTPQTVERFEEVFAGQVCLMHSNLSKSEKYLSYQSFASGEKNIIIGPRSALLVPSQNIGLIIIDEEQEDSFKQEQNPRYHAVDLARQIAKETSALLVLGSATPRIETYYKAATGEYDFFTLSRRFNKEELPPALIIDLRTEIQQKNYSPISSKMNEEIAKVTLEKRQALLFLNRRGSATFVSCRECGHVMLCKNCSIPLIFHVNSDGNWLRCHHCDYKETEPRTCPACGSIKIKYFGAGVDKVEAEVRQLFPSSKIAKVDSTTIKSKYDYINFYNDFKKGKIDIVIGTQMIAKGLDIPGVDLVGIISADSGLHLPHYRASERVFQILTQVSGRSGRRENIGKTVIQTYWPESAAILAASKHDYSLFYKSELPQREKFCYPPFTHLINVVSEHHRESIAEKNINLLAKELQERDIDFIGPGNCFYQRLHNRFRKHLIIKLNHLPDSRLSEITKVNPHLTFDVDPTNLL